jgi:hypothetical protein
MRGDARGSPSQWNYSEPVADADTARVYDEFFEPLSLALGHLVFAAAALEKTLFTDLVRRRVIRDGPEAVFGGQLISKLLRKPAGALIRALRALGYQEGIAEELTGVVERRNHFIHHLFEDPEFITVFAAREGMEQIVARVEALVEDTYGVAKKLEPEVSSGVEQVFGTPPHLLSVVKDLDPGEIDDAELRCLLEAVQRLPGFTEQ